MKPFNKLFLLRNAIPCIFLGFSLCLPCFASYKPDFTKGFCINENGQKGKNPSFIGACGGLKGANLSRTYLSGRKLDLADLRGANLFRTDLRNSSLIQAELQSADLSKSDLRGANLKDANLKDAVLGRAIFDENTILPIGSKEAKKRGMVFQSTTNYPGHEDSLKSTLGGIKKN